MKRAFENMKFTNTSSSAAHNILATFEFTVQSYENYTTYESAG